MTTANTETAETSTPATPPPKGRGVALLKKIILGLAAIVAIFLAVVAMQPADFRIVRSAAVAAPPSVVFDQVNDFRNWEAWSPWAKLDPAVKNTFEGPAAGPGAIFKWSGNDEVGEGIMTLMENRPPDFIQIKLEFIRPFPDTSTTEFTFLPEGDRTMVTWSMSGRKNFLSKAFCLFMDMDKMVGGDFEKGLASMKSVAESTAANSTSENQEKPNGDN